MLCETKDILVELDNLHAYKGRKTGRKALLPTYDFEAGRTYEFSPKKGRWKTSMKKISAGGKYVFNHISNGKEQHVDDIAPGDGEPFGYSQQWEEC